MLAFSLLMVSCAAPPYECTDPLGCLEIPPGSPVAIGTILATNGEMGPVGTESLQRVQKVLTEKDILLDHPIRLYRYGTDCTTDSARDAATEFATYPDLAAVIGPTCTDEAMIVIPIFLDAGIPLVGPVPDAESAFEMTERVLAAIGQVAIRMPDETLIIPRQALIDELHLSP